MLKSDSAYMWSSISDEPYHEIHCHSEYEIYYFMQGDVEYLIEGDRYSPSPVSLLLIPPNSMHGVTIRSAQLYWRASVHFLPELLAEDEQFLLTELFQGSCRYYPDVSPATMDFLFQEILDCKNMEDPLRKTALKCRITSLLTHVCRIHQQNKTPAEPKDERIQAIRTYLNGNLQKNIALEELSRKFRISKNHLNVLFRREIGVTAMHYLRIKRLVFARQSMRQGLSAEDAAYTSGFNDYSNFYRAYRGFFGGKPSAQRRNGNSPSE
ncbi:MAG: AraC family transcriptional regulator [Spirochaetaceae bacterium]|nr:AraC family transcriptional regulator [Spirochaetaceae bacterium]